jgi:flagellar protein FliS
VSATEIILENEGGVVSYNQALSAYRETRVRTASQGTLIVMLYDEVIKQMGAAIALFDNGAIKSPGTIEELNTHVIKSQEIITELMASLDMQAGGEIAKNLLALYTYFNQQLVEGNIEKKVEKFEFVRNMMDQLRSAWVEIVNTQAAPGKQPIPSGINIAG